MITTCKVCGAKNPPNLGNCSRCGAVLGTKESQTLTCGFCGKPNPPAAEICEFCGAYLLKTPPEMSKNGGPRKRRAAKGTTSPKDILPPSVEIRVLTPNPVNRVRFPRLPPPPPPPIKKPIGKRVKSIAEPILLGGIYIGFIALLVWMIMVMTGGIP